MSSSESSGINKKNENKFKYKGVDFKNLVSYLYYNSAQIGLFDRLIQIGFGHNPCGKLKFKSNY